MKTANGGLRFAPMCGPGRGIAAGTRVLRRSICLKGLGAAEPCSLFNCLNTTLLEVLKVIVHFFELVGGVTPPIRNLADDAK